MTDCPNPVTCPFVDTTEPHPVSDHPGMEDRRPENPKLWAYEPPDLMAGHTATSDEVIAVVRRGVESGTIKGEVVWWCQGTRVTEDGAVAGVLPGSLAWQNCFEGRIVRHKDCGWRLSIPVSDGGSET